MLLHTNRPCLSGVLIVIIQHGVSWQNKSPSWDTNVEHINSNLGYKHNDNDTGNYSAVPQDGDDDTIAGRNLHTRSSTSGEHHPSTLIVFEHRASVISTQARTAGPVKSQNTTVSDLLSYFVHFISLRLKIILDQP